MSNCLVLGASGQDGSFACEQLVSSGHTVIGAVRKASTTNLSNLNSLLSQSNDNFKLARFDLQDESSIYRLLGEVKPEYIFNYADQDHVSWSHSLPLYSCDVTSRSVNLLLEATRLINPESIVVQPISSNIYGNSVNQKISEASVIAPLSPYAIAKTTALHLCHYYRRVYSMNVVTPILFNHESERRTSDYVSRKISLAAARIKLNMQDTLKLGDISSQIDWGYAPEFVGYMIQLAFGHHFDDFLIGSGTLMSVKQFAEYCFSSLGLELQNYLQIDPSLLRPTKNKPLMADTSKIRSVLDFQPKIYGKSLADTLTSYDYKTMSQCK
jgi:GDPmannose 4,6-dehydratase